ncbi:hypothetical protein [Actinokineospora diospyrosa]|uniref:Uncharacterized protein n=1 Tax=Actinokineospora diospyrosa TaxID=103728 RepID=A0ABT1IMH7_9PSEU|nr:hypothetical protein [Actinokineospora diospyrosa]MCP2273880.1 hypothetical protein [Actinokineospora diospyrosa]
MSRVPPHHRHPTSESPPPDPTAGLLADFLTRWYGPDHHSSLDVFATIDSLNYGLNLLRGCLLTTDRVADAALGCRANGYRTPVTGAGRARRGYP